jgi:orotate phosphoribosyltransferase
MDLREKLFMLLKEKGFKKGKFLLTSGKESDFYIDCRPVTLHPEGAYLVGRLFFEKLKSSLDTVRGVGGMTMGADPMASAISLVSYLEGKPIPAFLIRKEPKKHGRGLWIEGIQNLPEEPEWPSGRRVTTGGSTIKAIERAREEGLQVIRVLAIVDRDEGGRENLKSYGYEIESLFTRHDFMKD